MLRPNGPGVSTSVVGVGEGGLCGVGGLCGLGRLGGDETLVVMRRRTNLG